MKTKIQGRRLHSHKDVLEFYKENDEQPFYVVCERDDVIFGKSKNKIRILFKVLKVSENNLWYNKIKPDGTVGFKGQVFNEQHDDTYKVDKFNAYTEDMAKKLIVLLSLEGGIFEPVE